MIEASKDARTQIKKFAPSGAVCKSFMESPAFVRLIMGPIGSGKSSGCVVEILKKSQEQRKSPDGVRRTRWAIIRNSYPELKTTTIKTWGQWMPLGYGKLTQDSPIIHHVKTAELDMEILFMALDRDDDVKKLLSLELTGAWINEAREVPKAIVDALTGRVGRFPAVNEGGCSWSGIMLDTNPCDDQSWIYTMAEETRPKGWEFFKQPSGDSPEAENLANLPPHYYERIKEGKDEDWIKVYVKGEYGYVTEGKPVYPMFRHSIHVSKDLLEPNPNIALTLGADFGLTPACIIGQKLVDGRWLIIDELTTEDCGIIRFAETLSKYLKSHYPDHLIESAWGDPAGGQRSGNDERTALQIMSEYTGFNWKPAPVPDNDLTIRLEAVKAALNRMVDGLPGITFSPKCKMLIKGSTSGYHYKSIRTGNGTQYHDTPAKNSFSHSADGLQYLLLGGGEGNVVLNKSKRDKSRGPRMALGMDYDLFGD